MSALVSAVTEFLGQRLRLGERELPITWGAFIFAYVLPIVGMYLFIRLLVLLVKRLLEKSRLKDESKQQLMKWFRLGYRLLFVVAVAILTAALLGDQIIESLRSVVGFLREPFYQSGGTSISVVTLVLLIPIFYVATWAGNALKRFMQSSVLDRLSLDASRRFSIANLLRYAAMGLVIVIGLSVIGINLSSLAVLFGVLGIGLGFGLQDVVANLFSGLVIIISRPIKEGDRIQVETFEGDVIQIRILSSVINTITNETIIVPNRQIVQQTVHNHSYEDPQIIIMTRVQVAYGSNLDTVTDVLMAVGQRSPHKVDGRSPRVLFRSFDDSGISVDLATPIMNAVDRHIAQSWAILEIWRAFKKSGVEIPFPQRDLHVKHLPPPVEVPESVQALPPAE